MESREARDAIEKCALGGRPVRGVRRDVDFDGRVLAVLLVPFRAAAHAEAAPSPQHSEAGRAGAPSGGERG